MEKGLGMNETERSRTATMILGICIVASACGRQTSHNGAPDKSSARKEEASIVTPAATDVSLPVIDSHLNRQRAEVHDQVLNPAQDGWQSEVFSAESQRIIDKLLTLATNTKSSQGNSQEIDRMLTSDFFCSPIRPQRMETVFAGQRFRVSRQIASQALPLQRHLGVNGINDVFSQLYRRSPSDASPEFHTKTVRILKTDKGMKTRHIVEVTTLGDDGMIERHWKWNANWRIDEESGEAKLAALEATDFEETIVARRLFSDRTPDAGKPPRPPVTAGLRWPGVTPPGL